MKDLRIPPFAPVLLESMRAIGYSMETAVADLVDNSISAGARNVGIRFPAGRPTYLGILDDGQGMSFEELVSAMRHGSSNPLAPRDSDDLGRFGLGLKTASLSQCRRLVVASKKGGALNAVCWDLDYVTQKEDWLLQVLSEQDLTALPCMADLKNQTTGTLVLWLTLDRAAADDQGDGAIFGERMDAVRRHLALVFHRFIQGPAGRLSLTINDNPIRPIDPFLSGHASTQHHPEEKMWIHGSEVRVRAYTLPHINQLTRAEIEDAGGREDLRRQQGFYVYRNRRLIIWGTWFRLFKQEELTKLTRVAVDASNDLDEHWTLDIKKSAAAPPEALKQRLRALIPRMCQPSKHLHTFRGKKSFAGRVVPLWERIEPRQGSVEYRISRSHGAVRAILAMADDQTARALSGLLRAIEETFPVEAFYNDRSQERIGYRAQSSLEPERREFLEQLAMNMLAAVESSADGRTNLLDSLEFIEPFNQHPDFAQALKERLRK